MQIHPDAPTDPEGYPVHPEKGYPICGRGKNDESESKNGRDRNDVPYCTLRAGWGVDDAGDPGDACRHHGGSGGAPVGEANGNYKHGAFSKHVRDSLTEDEEAAVDDLVGALEDPEEATGIVHELIADAYVKWNRSGDHRFLRELRQLLSEFNVAPSADQVELDATVDAEHSLDDDTKDAMREALRSRRGDS